VGPTRGSHRREWFNATEQRLDEQASMNKILDNYELALRELAINTMIQLQM
jgi:hypothetical protein